MRTIYFIALLFFSSYLPGQSNNQKPLIIKGTFQDIPINQLAVYLEVDPIILLIDTINIEKDGSFYYETFDIKEPRMLDLRNDRYQINDLMVAPGYELKIEADAYCDRSFYESIQITGTGGKMNQIFRTRFANSDDSYFKSLDGTEENLVTFIQHSARLQDSLLRELKLIKDPYNYYFVPLIDVYFKYSRQNQLFDYCRYNKFDAQETEQFMAKHSDHTLLENLNPDFLIAPSFRLFVNFSNLSAKLMKDYEDNPALKNHQHLLHKITQIYSAKIQEYALMHQIGLLLFGSDSQMELEEKMKICQPYLTLISNKNYLKKIDRIVAMKM